MIFLIYLKALCQVDTLHMGVMGSKLSRAAQRSPSLADTSS